MTKIARHGDNIADPFGQPSIIIATATKTFVNGKAIARVGDMVTPHLHIGNVWVIGATIVSGSPTVFAEGKAVARVGDPISCGGWIAAGSTDTSAD